MPIRNDANQWGAVSLALHWITVAMVLGLVLVGFLMQELPNAQKVAVYALHKSFGLTVLALTVLRLLWRLVAGAPAPVPGTPRWQAWAASATHVALYFVLLAMPISGWLYNSAAGYPLQWFKLFNLPSLSARSTEIREFAHDAHETLFLVLAAIVTVHALAAFKHHYFDRDRTLVRMLPILKPRTDPSPQDPPPGA
ncbi:cytochrome b [Arenimonas sp. MALMAid1274]|uniref:cytochrome b n=1 Tax=Arenimonas sp. MALMAid1274 TaxID=3411630 RepID=UPI003BA1A4EB